MLLQPLQNRIFLGGGDENAMVADLLDGRIALQRLLQTGIDLLPVIVRVAVGERELDLILLHRIAIDGDAGRVGAAVRHLDQHRLEHRPELRLQLRVLEIETDDSTHRLTSLI
jgi:hypothetical protein